jgi:hypothetical protein
MYPKICEVGNTHKVLIPLKGGLNRVPPRSLALTCGVPVFIHQLKQNSYVLAILVSPSLLFL